MKKLILTLSIVLFAGAAFAGGSASGCTNTNVDKHSSSAATASTGSSASSPTQPQTATK